MPQPPESYLTPSDIETIRQVVSEELRSQLDAVSGQLHTVRGEADYLIENDWGKNHGFWHLAQRLSLIGGIVFGAYTLLLKPVLTPQNIAVIGSNLVRNPSALLSALASFFAVFSFIVQNTRIPRGPSASQIIHQDSPVAREIRRERFTYIVTTIAIIVAVAYGILTQIQGH
jgi:hypothetical protein